MARSGGDSLKHWELRRGGPPDVQAKVDRSKVGYEPRPVRLAKVEVQSQSGVGHFTTDVSWTDDIPSCPVYSPTKEEFEDPLAYIRSIAPAASKYGICKIVSPLIASVPAGHVLSKEKVGFKFTPRVQPMRLSNWDCTDTTTFLMSPLQYTFQEYEKMANRVFARRYGNSASLSSKFVEAEFWRELVNGKVLNVEYGCDIEGSAFSSSANDPLGRSKWNLNNLPRLSESTLRLLETAIPGVTEPMLYIGMLFSMFAWHVEDHYLYSINYHHCGAFKTWYGVPGHSASDFERVVHEHVYNEELLARQEGLGYNLLIGKTTMFAPKLLSENGVTVYRAVQGPGEFIITFPRSYHAGFSHGFNCCEAVNFAMGDWFPFGAAACRRYELLHRIPLLPHEELLCKEALAIAAASGASSSKRNHGVPTYADHNRSVHSVKVAFVRFVRFQHQVRWLLQRKGAQSIFRSPGFNDSVICGLCKHMCYVAFVTCRCSPTPICLNHANAIRECTCGCNRSVVLREGLQKLEVIAYTFEDDYRVYEEVCRDSSVKDGSTLSDAMMEESRLDGDDYSGYTPYGDHFGPVEVSCVSSTKAARNKPSNRQCSLSSLGVSGKCEGTLASDCKPVLRQCIISNLRVGDKNSSRELASDHKSGSNGTNKVRPRIKFVGSFQKVAPHKASPRSGVSGSGQYLLSVVSGASTTSRDSYADEDLCDTLSASSENSFEDRSCSKESDASQPTALQEETQVSPPVKRKRSHIFTRRLAAGKIRLKVRHGSFC